MNITVCGALNLESVDGNPYQLIGGAYYSAFSIARYVENLNLIGCIGTDVDEVCLNQLNSHASNNNIYLKLNYFNGLNFKHNINTKSLSDIKEYGDYKEFFYHGNCYRTNYLVLTSGSPKLHKSALDCCVHYDCLILDSKLIYYQTAINDVVELFHKCNIYSANSEEMALMLECMGIKCPYELFRINRKLKFVIQHCHASGGSLYTVNGEEMHWKVSPIPEKIFINDVGAGDIFLGAFLGNYIINDNLIDAIKDAAAASLKSITKIGMEKISPFNEYQYLLPNIKINHSDWRLSYVKN